MPRSRVRPAKGTPAPASKRTPSDAAHKKAAKSSGGKVERRLRPGTKALREIRKFQRTVDLQLRKAPTIKLMRERMVEFETVMEGAGSPPVTRMAAAAAHALHEALEAYIVGLLEDANLCAIHAGRVTLMNKDVHLAVRLSSSHPWARDLVRA